MKQREADALLAAKKNFEAGARVELTPGTGHTYVLESPEPESFLLDASRSSIRLTKVSVNHRVRTTTVLARLDLDGPPHRNPDGERIDCPHLHVYREGFETKWAYPLDRFPFTDPTDLVRSFLEFCDFCSIEHPSSVQDGII